MASTRGFILPPFGTDGDVNAITQKGEVQGESHSFEGFRSDFGRLAQWLLGTARPLCARERWLLGYCLLLAMILTGLTAFVADFAPAAGGSLWPLVALAASAIVAERQSVQLSARAAISVSALPIVLAAVIYGPLAAICVSIASLLPTLRAPYARWLIWTSTRSIAAGAAGLVAFTIDDPTHRVFGRLVVAVTAATLVEQVGDLLLGAVVALLRRVQVREILQDASTMVLAMPLYVPITALLVYAYREISPWSVVLFLFPALVAQKLFLLYNEQRSTAGELTSALARQEKSHLQFASALVAALDAGDEYTAGHSTAVAIYARDIARQLGLSEEQQRLVHLAGLVHDIGKIGLPHGLLEKPGPLGVEERLEMEKHAAIGERILANVEDYVGVARIVRHHHEWIDGSGYPDGLRRDEIPLLSRIIAVADAYNAMTSKRSYRASMASGVARIRLAQGADTQFDLGVVAAFEAVLASASSEYRTAEGRAFRREGQNQDDLQGDLHRQVLHAVAS